MPLPAQTGISGIRIGKMGINTLFNTIPGRICYCHIVPELNIELVYARYGYMPASRFQMATDWHSPNSTSR